MDEAIGDRLNASKEHAHNVDPCKLVENMSTSPPGKCDVSFEVSHVNNSLLVVPLD